MLIPVICISCGMSIGDKAAVFRRLYRKLVKETLASRGTRPENAYADPSMQINCGKILDELGIVHACCRAEMMTTMEFDDYY